MTDETLRQQNFNAETVARFAGFMPQPVHSIKMELLFECDCGREVKEEELHRNGGSCDRCAIGK